MDNTRVVTLDNYRHSKTQQSLPTAIDESLAQDQINDEEEEVKLYNVHYIQMEYYSVDNIIERYLNMVNIKIIEPKYFKIEL